jgi:hypothetical protein
MREDLTLFFEELKDIYIKEAQEFNLKAEQLEVSGGEEFLSYMAFNLSKNILHGPLPDSLHNRMILSSSKWSRLYVEYLES